MEGERAEGERGDAWAACLPPGSWPLPVTRPGRLSACLSVPVSLPAAFFKEGSLPACCLKGQACLPFQAGHAIACLLSVACHFLFNMPFWLSLHSCLSVPMPFSFFHCRMLFQMDRFCFSFFFCLVFLFHYYYIFRFSFLFLVSSFWLIRL